VTRIAIYPGTFDPVTYGHLDVIERASKIYDRVFVGVAHSRGKEPLFNLKERVAMLTEATANIKNVTVEDFDGLSVNYARKKGTRVILRGLRMISDFEYEFQMALTNRKFAGELETVFMMTSDSHSYVSSKLIKEAVALGADVKDFVPDFVADRLKKKLAKNR